MIGRLKKEALRRGMKLMSDPRVMKWMSDPRVMQLAMQALQAPGRMRAGWDRRTRRLADALGLATQAELETLRVTIARLEGELRRARGSRGEHDGHDRHGRPDGPDDL